jgi:MFS family permease
MVLLSWLVLEITNSPVLVGLIQALRVFPTSLGIFGGIIADRVNDRKKLLLGLIASNIVFSIVFGILILTQTIEIWHIVILTMLQNTSNVFQQPTRQVFAIDILGTSRITNAVTLNTLAFRLSSLIGASLVGMLIYYLGIGSFYIWTGIFYLFASITLSVIRVERRTFPSVEKTSIRKELREVLQYIKRSKEILGLQLIAVFANLFGFPLTNTLLPIFVRDVLHVGADGLGWLMSASSAGAFLAVAYLALKDSQHKGRLLCYSSIGWGISLLLLSLVRTFALSSIFLFAVGTTNSVSMVMVSTLLMMLAVEHMRGRVMGVRMLAVFPLSLGNLIAGILANAIGVSATISIQGILFIISVSAILLYAPALVSQSGAKN